MATLPAAAPIGPAAHAPNLTATFKEYLVRYRRELDARIVGGEPGIAVGRLHARAMDGLLSALLPCTEATLAPKGKWIECTIAAVG